MKTYINKEAMFTEFRLMGMDALSMNHYDLEANSESPYTVEEWKAFLSEADVQDYIKKEMDIIRTSQMNKIVQESSSSRSVGQAQLLNTLKNMADEEKDAEGPAFIFCYVPLNDEQKFAPNVLEVDGNGHPKA